MIKPLPSLPIKELIGRPIDCCFRAQGVVNEATCRFIREMGFRPQYQGQDPNEWESAFVSFTCTIEGQRRRVSVPLLTLVPIPVLAIERASMSFIANTEMDEEGHMRGTYGSATGNGWGYNEETRYTGQVKVKFSLSRYDPPTGLAKILNEYNNRYTFMRPKSVKNNK